MIRTPDCFSPDGSVVALASDDFVVRLWRSEEGVPTAEPMAHRAIVSAVAFDASGRRLLTGSADNTLRLWDGERGKPLLAVKTGAAVTAAAMSPDGKQLLSGALNGVAQLWSADDGNVHGQPMEHAGAIRCAVFAGGLPLLLTGSDDKTARLWDANTGKPVGAVMEHEGAVVRAGFGPGDSQVWTQAADGSVRLFAASTGKPVGDAIRHRELSAADMASSGKLLATAGADKQIRVWRLGATTPLREWSHGGAVRDLRFSPDGRHLVSAGDDGVAQVWLAESGQAVGEPLRHKVGLLEAGFDRDGKRVLTLDAGRVARVWEVDSSKLLGRPMNLASAAEAENPKTVDQTLNNNTLTRLGGERLVTVGGITGVFTPLTSATDQPLGDDERKNLLSIIDRLKREVTEIQGRNLKLSADLATLRERPSAPDDFATGVQQSLDELQQRMATMRNSTSGFAVRDFKLDASVFVQVSPLGSIEYRFVQPGDQIEPQALSRLSLQIVPVPKDSLAGVWTPDLFQPERAIGDLPEVNATLARQLESAGLFSVGEFLQVGTRARAQAHLEALLGVERQRLGLWSQQAMLMTLRGMVGRAALGLMEAGLSGFADLAAQTPAALRARYDEARARRPDLQAPELGEPLAALWIRAARQYLGLPAVEEPDAGPPPPPPPAPPAPT